ARLYARGIAHSGLRWLVARKYVEHGQELSDYGGEHRSFHRGEGFFFDQTTCVVLTPGGAAFVDQFLKGPVGALHLFRPPESDPVADGPIPVGVKPCWDPRRRELSLHGTVIKRFRVPAPNQEVILGAFEEEGWPDHIDDPPPVRGDIDPRTRLHDAINRLNGRQVHRLLRFSGNGNGDGVSWAFHQTNGLRQTESLRAANG